MKKIIKYVNLICFICLCTTILCKPLKSAKAAVYEDLPECGYTINKIKCSSLNDINVGGTVLSYDYLNKLNIVRNQFRKEGVMETISNTSKEEIAKEISLKISNEQNDELNVFDFTNLIGTSLSYKYNSTLSAYYTRLYNVSTSTYVTSNSTIKDYKTTDKRKEFCNETNLNSYYISDLERVYSGSMSIENLFDIYGTHLCASVNYGGTFYLTMSVKTNKVVLNKSQIAAIESKLNSNIMEVLKCRQNFNDSVFKNYGFDSESSFTEFKISYTGGEPFGSYDIAAFNDSYSKWTNSIINNPSVVSYGPDGLIPLWDILPDRFISLKQKMKDVYVNYAKNNNVIKDDLFNGYHDKVESDYYSINEGDQLITDDYIVNNKFNISDVSKINIQLMKRYFLKITFDIGCTIWLEDDGYQNIGLGLGNANISNMGDCLVYKTYEHTKNHKKSDRIYYVTSFDLDISQINDNMNICLIGSGKLDDDWYCSGLKVRVTLS